MTEVADNTLVDGRYRIVERIGSGGMADVYRAEDTHLGREVAIKILHRRFAQDAEFVERFRREAKSAAGLQHPGVVGIFDRGEHDGTYYIAMEHVPGRTLKELIATEGPLPQERAIELGIQILQAAGFAHRRGVIHRDLKSGNVMLDDEGNAKVTDFGIARAGTSEMTETGSIMGTAQYLSPEQAQGHAVTAASDLYSIGVILYEMLAGRLPFQGDSAVAVALKHLAEPPPPLSQFRPDVSPVLESVVMGALAKDPSARWQSDEELAAALAAARGQLEGGPNGGQDTAAFAPVPLPVEEPTAPEAAPAPDGPPAPPPPPVDERRRRWPLFVIGPLLLALVALLAYLAISSLTAAPQVAVPKVVGKQVLEARTVLERAGFDVRQVSVPSSREFGVVVEQDPDPGDDADEGSVVTLEVSRGPGRVRVPSVEGLPEKLALRQLNKAGLKVTLDRRPSDSVREGLAIRTVPKEGAAVDRGTRVRLFISSGAEKVTVPDVVGLSRGSAEGQLRGKGLEVVVRQQQSDRPADQVIAQSPAAGTRVEQGASVTITVATTREEEEQADVPDVVGLSAGQAAGALRSAGFGVARQERRVTDEDDDGKVVAQRPGGGSQVARGGSVTIVVGKYKEPKAEPRREPEPPPGPQPPVP